MARAVLIVRLGALGDLVHALPVAAALREAWPDARIDWLVDARYHTLLRFAPMLDRAIVLGGGASGSVAGVVRQMRRERYDMALDLQGLLKSAVLARLSGARQVVGFATMHLRERAAGLFYSTRVPVVEGGHVIQKNLSMTRALGVEALSVSCPLTIPASPAVAEARAALGAGDTGAFAILNPGAGWPNKQWPPDRFGAVSAHLARRHGMRSIVLWGPRERPLAEAVARASGGTAVVGPATGIGDVLALARAAALFVAGDTGPLQLAAAVGAPVVGVFGPTNPVRNGPWSGSDVTVSRFEQCDCHHKRRCRRTTPCLLDIGVGDVTQAVDRRLERLARG